MKKIAFVGIVLLLMINPLSALEKRDCSELKKLSKAFVACKSYNFKAGLTNAGSQVKKNTIGKIKKDKTTNEETSSEGKIAKTIKEKTAGLKNPLKGIFSGTTKQYPKGTK
jgi:hypothetical protein